MQLRLGNGREMELAAPAGLEAALATLDNGQNSFAILGVEDETYLQTRMDAEGFIVERRDGHAGTHMRAFRAAPHPVMVNDHFDRAEMIAIFNAYLRARPMPDDLRWEPLAAAPSATGLARVAIYGIGALLLLIAFALPLAKWWAR